MKKIGLLLGASVVAFTIGLMGFYSTMPYVAPDHIKRATGDTLSDAAVDSLIRARMEEARQDSMQAVREAALEIAGLTEDSLEILRQRATHERILQDSLQALQANLNREQNRRDSLLAALEKTKARAKELENSEQTAEEISRAFIEIEDRDMRPILEHIHPTVLRKLYEQASNKDRSRILRALSPDQAARFLAGLVDPSLVPDTADTSNAGTTLAGDSTAFQPTDSQLQ